MSDPPDDAGPAAEVPYGPLTGKLRHYPAYDHLGKVRPLGPGEYVAAPDGSWESEMTYTVPLGKQWAVVPGLWLKNGVPTHVTEDEAAKLATSSGLNWATFPDETQANAFANQREAIWQKTPFGRSDHQKPLWSLKWPPPGGQGAPHPN